MNEAEAAWVRDHAWTAVMRKTYASVPAVLTMCPCEYGPCGHCSAGSQHDGRCPCSLAGHHGAIGIQTTIFDFSDHSGDIADSPTVTITSTPVQN
ncbi:DUF6248 family natural product biosynthesis protein [Actinomyces naeslundii]|uniref:DUF6248 family natural product biosynthesis protein n=1 Tax=Actinomyces naeslundii TaxID=1655 RepID=UPI003B979895